jgi:polysaccharide deacetylase
MIRNAIITFDYEVFLGRRTGTIENCVIKPTKLIIDILKENKSSAIFFVDATWLLFLKENLENDFQVVAEQLKEICESGSSVELHLHPQWLDAAISGQKIVFNSFKHYNLQSLEHKTILDLFKRSVNLLQSITGQQIKCFRAGGWCIEPFTSIKDAFKANKIKYDFSVVPGTYLNDGQVYDYDFTRVPGLQFYKFQDTVNKIEPDGGFLEVPVSTYNNNIVYRVINKALLMIKKDKIFGDGIGIKEKSKFKVISHAFRFSKWMLTLDKTSNMVFKYLLKSHFRMSSLVVIVSHPKAISSESLQNLRYITKKYRTLTIEDLNKGLLK